MDLSAVKSKLRPHRIGVFLALSVPCLLWAYLMRGYLWGHAVLPVETLHIYSVVKYFWDNVGIGQFPVWDPFVLCGTAEQTLLVYVGIFNPVWLLVYVLSHLGVSIYHAFIWTLVVYYLIGQLGFYCLAKAVLRHPIAAYVAFLLFLFSSFSLFVLPQYHPALSFVPMVWFFYFLCRFCQSPGKGSFVGMTFFLMLIGSVYFPLYFVTVFLLVMILYALIYLGKIGGLLKGWGGFIRAHLFLTGICAIALVVALLPTAQAYQSSAAKEQVANLRAGGKGVYGKGMMFDNFRETTDGALSARMFPEDLYSNLDQVSRGNEGFFYMSYFAYLVLILGAFTRVTPRILFLSLLSFLLLLLCLSDAAPLHKFLYQHVFYFKLLRNLSFLLPYLLASVALLAAEQFRWLLKIRNKSDLLRGFWSGFAFLVHTAAAVFLRAQENVIATSFLAILLSAVFWISFPWLPLRSRKIIFFPLLLLSILVQPLEVFDRHVHGEEPFDEYIRPWVEYPRARPVFSYVRPLPSNQETDPAQEHAYVTWYRLSQQDSPGIFMRHLNAILPYWTTFAYQKLPKDALDSFTHHKFFIYDRFETASDTPEDIEKIAAALRAQWNLAFVAAEGLDQSAREQLDTLRGSENSLIPPQRLEIEGPSEQLRVVDFQVNSIQLSTNFPGKKFLVYTDGYLKGWQAFLDGKEVPVYRANIGFKGVLVPAGAHSLLMRYGSFASFYFLVWAVFLGMWGWMLGLNCTATDRKGHL